MQYCRDKSAANNGDLPEFNDNNDTTSSFKPKEKVTGKTGNNGKKRC